ncbi:Protein priB [Fusarium oxysporum f. sp. cubense race 1]|uniref:Protein priB n=1 Tax=Fusarium oxysporum f. sp. cubense (strain race 1) TaxID=1229664 RepID=N4THD8_FUSC1|nr:Protein priB [Fusarium oxysporum f. sp. cubense race 1]
MVRCKRNDDLTESLCVFESHRRGLWRRDVSGRSQRFSDTQVFQAPDLPNRRNSYQNRAPESVSASSRSDQSPFTPASFVANYQDTRGLSLGAALNSDRSVEGEAGGSMDMLLQHNLPEAVNPPRKHDPVDMGLISRPSAQNLYEGLLLTMIITISSRIFQPESHKPIRDHAEVLLGQALLACDSAIENIWAIICMYHWKDANDTRGYTLIGFALRMAASAEWNMTRRSVSYDIQGLQDLGQLQVRQRRDKDRVWLALGNIDRTQWMTMTEWTYPLGDGKAVGGHELTGIASKVYESMMRTRVDSRVSPSSFDFETFQKEMDDFNNRIAAWGDYWQATFATFPNPEPFQTPLIYLFRDYMRLYFNSVFLHRMLVSENRSTPHDLITHTARICYCSALSVLRQAIEMGELDIIYYLWDTAHLMIAYSAMMIPKLLRQDIDESSISKNEAINTITQVTSAYVIAAKSMGHSDPQNNAVLAQSRLLSAILARLKAELTQTNPDMISSAMPDNISISGLSWIEDQLNRSTLFSDGRMEPPLSEYVDMDTQTVGQPEDMSSFIPQMYEELDLMSDDDFMSSIYFEVGLLSWNEPGIFIQPH